MNASHQIMQHLGSLNTAAMSLAVILLVGMLILAMITRRAERLAKRTGLGNSLSTITVAGSKSLPVRHYVSDMQGLAGKPDALVSEGGYIIPVERKPLARKLRDRYVAQILVYMRLIEEFEGKKPPYGYLILGPNCRRVKIMNSVERQAWLQALLDQMHAVINGAAAVPAPLAKKCRKCDVSQHCQFAFKEIKRAHGA